MVRLKTKNVHALIRTYLEEKFTYIKKVTLPLVHKNAEWREIKTEGKTAEEVVDAITETLLNDLP